MKKYNLDTDDVTFSIVKGSNGAFYLIEKIQCLLPRDYFKSKPIYFYEDLIADIEFRKNLYASCMSKNFQGRFIIKTNGHNLPCRNGGLSGYNNPLTPSL